MKNSRWGFVLPELIVVIGIIATLAALVTVNLIGFTRRPSRQAMVDTLIADVGGQQTKAMTGVTHLGNTSAFGVYFMSDRYVRFAGSNYNPADPANVVEVLPTGFSLSTTLPQATVVFAAGSGEIVGFLPGSNSVTGREEELGEQTVITLNQLGVVTGVQ